MAEILEIARSEAERGNAIADQLNYIEQVVQSLRNPMSSLTTGLGGAFMAPPAFRLPSTETKVDLASITGGALAEKKDDKTG
jgi:hypothetical protein